MICRDLDIDRALASRKRQRELIEGRTPRVNDFLAPMQPGAPRPRDPFWANITCDLTFIGANGASAVSDAIGNNWTSVAGGAISTATATPWDTYSWLSSAGSNSYALSPGGNTNFDLGAGDFGIMCWVYYNPLPAAGAIRAIYGLRASGAGTPYSSQWYIVNTGGAYTMQWFYSTNGTSTTNLSVSIPAPSATTWYRYFVVRSGGNLRFYIGTAQVGATQSVSGTLFYSASVPMHFGQSDTVNANAFRGNMKQFRIYKGVAPDPTTMSLTDPPLPAY